MNRLHVIADRQAVRDLSKLVVHEEQYWNSKPGDPGYFIVKFFDPSIEEKLQEYCGVVFSKGSYQFYKAVYGGNRFRKPYTGRGLRVRYK